MKLAEEKRIKRFMEARGGSVGKGYVRVNGKWVKKKETEDVKKKCRSIAKILIVV